MSLDTLPREIAALIEYTAKSAGTASSLKSLQEKIVSAIAERLPSYNWTGFYMLDPDDAISQGICGAAVNQARQLWSTM